LKDVAIISCFADGLLQSLEAGGKEIYSALRSDEVLERVYRLIVEGIKTSHSPGICTLTNNWVETIKDYYGSNKSGSNLFTTYPGNGSRRQDGNLHRSPKLMRSHQDEETIIKEKTHIVGGS
jgi:hypothetical protein